MTALYTVGHGTRTAVELAELVAGAGIGRLVDVRRHPGSRRHPDLGAQCLAATLAQAGVAYEWWGDALGGRRRAGPPPSRHPAWRNPSFRAYAEWMDGPEFRTALTGLLSSLPDQLPDQPATAVCCSETLWWRCHRRMIADASTLRGTLVWHLVGPGGPQAHPLNPAVRPDDDGWPVYDVGVDRPLVPAAEGGS